MLGFGCGNHALDAPHDPLGENSISRAQYLGVIRCKNVLRAEEHLLVQFLAGPHTSELDLYISTNRESRQANEVSGDIDNADWLSHIKQEDFSSASKCAGLEHKLHGL